MVSTQSPRCLVYLKSEDVLSNGGVLGADIKVILLGELEVTGSLRGVMYASKSEPSVQASARDLFPIELSCSW
jgi:hypothetical protein